VLALGAGVAAVAYGIAGLYDQPRAVAASLDGVSEIDTVETLNLVAATRRQLRRRPGGHVRGAAVRRPLQRRVGGAGREHGGTRLMAASSADIEVFAGAPEAEPPRPRVLLVGSALASGAAAMVVLALVAVYARMRADVIAGGDRWLPEDVTVQLSPGNMGMVTLLMSAVTVAWAVYSLRNDDRVHAYLAFGLSILLGAAYIPTVAYGWQQLGVGATSSTQALLIFTITGLHVAMTGVGLAFLAVMAFRALGGQLTGRAAEGASAAALYWFVTVAVYGVVWYAITITK
jgi:heme/copper-type cytochrome/quinol oxidase subunit 3